MCKISLKIKKLIKLVKARPALWDPKHDRYNDKTNGKILWEEIGMKLNWPAERCKLKWRNIRDVFRRELKKYQSRLSDPKKEGNKLPRWHYFYELLFLTEHLNGLEKVRDLAQKEFFEDCFHLKCEPELLEEYDYEVNVNADTDDEFLLNLEDDKSQITFDEDGSAELFKKSEFVDVLQFVDGNDNKPQKSLDSSSEDKAVQTMKTMEKNDMESDSDYHFLMSLLPFLKTVPHRRKMLVRTKIQNIFSEEMEAEDISS